MSLVPFDPSIAVIKQSFIVSQLSVVQSFSRGQFCSIPSNK